MCAAVSFGHRAVRGKPERAAGATPPRSPRLRVNLLPNVGRTRAGGERQVLRCRSMIARIPAITSSCGILGAVEAIARSTLARNHASCAAASSLVANSDSTEGRSAMGAM